MRTLAVIGSTGSIGRSALDVARNLKERFEVEALACGHFSPLICEQIKEFAPKTVAVNDPAGALELKKAFPALDVRSGKEGVASLGDSADVVILSVVGLAGLDAALRAVKAGKRLAIATKEVLVSGGELVFREARKTGAEIIPVDSEHSAIFQCLAAGGRESIARLLITASGGPFRGKDKTFLENVTPKEALAHPVWKMGPKISVDSATMMNKGLEVIEASRLFSVPAEKIDVVIHPQSIVHSLVEFCDGAQLAQLSVPDMRLAIQYALTYPVRLPSPVAKLDLGEIGKLEFGKPDTENFPCLKLAYEALKKGGIFPAVLNGANETAVERFLRGECRFLDIPRFVEKKLSATVNITDPDLEDILEADRFGRE
jgi:1-deoxy-D-xylulose-5-phosphate reductoisomerase